jgi:hypothetical protein
MMGHSMQGCMQMLEVMNGGAGQRPNQEWRRGQIGPGRREAQSRATRQIIAGMSGR